MAATDDDDRPKKKIAHEIGQDPLGQLSVGSAADVAVLRLERGRFGFVDSFGARFKGTNQHGPVRWSTKPRVVVADEGREFAFVVAHLGKDMTKWSYRFEPDGEGTTVTESFEMLVDMPWYIAASERWLMGVKDRKADLEAAMEQTLQRLKVVADGGV